MPNSAVSVTGTATPIVAKATVDRVLIVISNESTQDMAFGDAATVTFATGTIIKAGKKFIIDLHELQALTTNNLALWGIVASGTADIRIWEWNRRSGT